MQSFYSHGKLLLTGEYVVLDGALALAIPTKKGQALSVEQINDPLIVWKSIDEKGQTWFEGQFHLNEIYTMPLISIEANSTSDRLLQILIAAKKLNPAFLSDTIGYDVTTTLEFARDWGLGSSSTLISNIALWAHVDPYELLKLTFGGSGYDIACARNRYPLTYQLESPLINKVVSVSFEPSFSKALYFVHLNKKQDSREGISRYTSKKTNDSSVINDISTITNDIIACASLSDFNSLITKHEQIISKLIDRPTAKKQHFDDFYGSIKSLGAWGGDFVLATAETNPTSYFKEKGYNTVIPYKDMILK